MGQRYAKKDVQFHSDGNGKGLRPAVNVKYNPPYMIDKVAKAFAITEENAEKQLGEMYEVLTQCFWNDVAQELATEHLGSDAKVYSEGRSNGWLVVDGLEPFEKWDAVQVSKWHKFEAEVHDFVKYYCKVENVIGELKALEALEA